MQLANLARTQIDSSVKVTRICLTPQNSKSGRISRRPYKPGKVSFGLDRAKHITTGKTYNRYPFALIVYQLVYIRIKRLPTSYTDLT